MKISYLLNTSRRRRRKRSLALSHKRELSTTPSPPPNKKDDINHKEENESTITTTNSTGRNFEKDAEQPPPQSMAHYFVNDVLPLSMRPYARLMRMDRPIGTMLLLWPCLWSCAVAMPNGEWIDLNLAMLFTTGSFVMRGAGCTINDMWDSEYDKSVSRTRTRPLANGDLTHTQALAFLSAQLSVGLGVLLSLPNTYSCFLWGASSLPLVIVYPLMKRYTNYPQLVLGMTFNWGAIMGWVATTEGGGIVDWSVVGPLYVSGIAWTMVYDTIYAHQDKEDDSKLGLKSTALHFGNNTKPILHGCSAVALANWMVMGYNLGYASPLFYVGCGLAWSHMTWQIRTADLNDDGNLMQRFRSNNQLGGIVFASCLAGNITAVGVI